MQIQGLQFSYPIPTQKEIEALYAHLTLHMPANDMILLRKEAEPRIRRNILIGKALFPHMSLMEVIVAIFPHLEIEPLFPSQDKGITLLFLVWVVTQIPAAQLVLSNTLDVTEVDIAIWQAISKKARG